MQKYWIPVVLVIGAIGCAVIAAMQPGNPEATTSGLFGLQTCNVGVVSIEGDLYSESYNGSQDSLTSASLIASVANDRNNKALIVLVDSAGGSATAALEIADALGGVQIPTAAFVRGSALSGGYWIAAKANYIVATPVSLIGSIGVNSSYLDETKLNEKGGYTYQQIVSGSLKDVGDVNKIPTAADKKFLQDLTDKISKIFMSDVAESRNLSDTQIKNLSDASFYLAAEAKELNLIDMVGIEGDAVDYLASVLDVATSTLVLCDPIRPFPADLNLDD